MNTAEKIYQEVQNFPEPLALEGKRPLSPPMLNARNDRSLDFLMRKSDGVIDGLDQSYRSMAA